LDAEASDGFTGAQFCGGECGAGADS
jgi:hypothetical protein